MIAQRVDNNLVAPITSKAFLDSKSIESIFSYVSFPSIPIEWIPSANTPENIKLGIGERKTNIMAYTKAGTDLIITMINLNNHEM